MSKRWLMLLAAVVTSCHLCRAGYRNIDGWGVTSGPREATTDAQAAQSAPRVPDSVRVEREGGVERLANRGGRWDPLTLGVRESVRVTVTRPDVPAGDAVFAYTVNGGRVNGTNITTTLIAGAGGELAFLFTSGSYFGDYPVVLRHAGRESVVNFWVGETEVAP